MNFQFSHHCQTRQELQQALQAAQKVLEANPNSIFAHILVGGLMEAQGELRGALAAYQAAQSEFYRQYPDCQKGPLYLTHKISMLQEKLARKP